MLNIQERSPCTDCSNNTAISTPKRKHIIDDVLQRVVMALMESGDVCHTGHPLATESRSLANVAYYSPPIQTKITLELISSFTRSQDTMTMQQCNYGTAGSLQHPLQLHCCYPARVACYVIVHTRSDTTKLGLKHKQQVIIRHPTNLLWLSLRDVTELFTM